MNLATVDHGHMNESSWDKKKKKKKKSTQLIHRGGSHNEGLLLKTSKFRESWLYNINYLIHKTLIQALAFSMDWVILKNTLNRSISMFLYKYNEELSPQLQLSNCKVTQMSC